MFTKSVYAKGIYQFSYTQWIRKMSTKIGIGCGDCCWGITNKLFMLAKFIYGVWFGCIVYANMEYEQTCHCEPKHFHSVWHSFDSL